MPGALRMILMGPVLLLGSMLVACSTSGPAASTPAAGTPSQVMRPADASPTPGTATPTVGDPTPTATIEILGGPDFDRRPLSPLSPGEEIIVDSIYMIDERTGWGLGGAAGSADHVLFTDDGGHTWIDRSPAVEVMASEFPPQVILAPLSRSAALVTYPRYDAVWKTSDSGVTWTAGDTPSAYAVRGRLASAGEDRIWFLKSIEAGMGNEYVDLFQTEDGGASWTKIVDPYTDDGLHACMKTGIAFNNNGEGWITLNCQGFYPEPFIYHSLDYGRSWEPVPLPLPGALPLLPEEGYCYAYSPLALGGTTVIVVNCLTIEADGGTHHEFLYRNTGSDDGWRIALFPGGELVLMDASTIGALGRELNISDDLGESWTKVKAVAWDGQFSFVDPDNGWAVARAGDQIALVRTGDGGRTWHEIQPSMAE